MTKPFKVLFLSILLSAVALQAETVIIKDPGYYESPIRDGYKIFPDSLIFDSEAEEIEFPDLGTFVRLGDYNFPNLRKVILNNVDYMPGASFMNMPKLEEVVVKGLVGHFDCAVALHCPNLRSVRFEGPISSTGGPQFAYDCPNLEEVVFEKFVVDFGLNAASNTQCPKFKGYDESSVYFWVDNTEANTKTDIDTFEGLKELQPDLEALARWQAQVLTAGDSKWMRGCTYTDAKHLLPALLKLESHEAKRLAQAMEYAWNLGDEVKSDLEILKESPEYAADTTRSERFVYAQPTDSLLTITRQRFRLDSVAGEGDDFSRIKNLMCWVHDNIQHDGSNGLPTGPRNLRNIYDSCRRDSCGANCRALAICLTEALLSVGLPARFLTCESKKWDSDYDCHVICVAWCASLGKWVWVDPTFAAYVTDENGLPLHPGEVRQRLRNDLPLVLNEDANWNHRSKQTKEYYLDQYMAKNLYIISATLRNQAEPEGDVSAHGGRAAHPQGPYAALLPLDSNYTNCHILTTDDAWFWQSPD